MIDNTESQYGAAEAASTNTIEIQGQKAYRIAWLRLDEGGMINLYSPPLKHPVLRLFPTQRGLLAGVGIDPHDIGVDPYYGNFYALYRENPHRLNTKGNPYKDVVDLVPIAAGKTDPVIEILSFILEEVRDIRDYLYHRVNPSRSQSQAIPEPQPLASQAVVVHPEPPVPLPKEKDQLIAMLGARRYVDCIAVLGLEAIRDRSSEGGLEQFANAIRPRIVPATVTDEQLATACKRIAEEWTADSSWKPMVIALAYYVNETGNGGKKGDVLLKAKGLYLSLS